MGLRTRLVGGGLSLVAALALAGSATAQESKSAALAKQLSAALEAGKLDSIAAKDPSAPDVFCAALYFPGAQLLAVSGTYSVPQLLSDRLDRKEYRDVYMDLNGAATPATKVFIQDAGGDGIKLKREDNQAFDIVELGGKQTLLDGDWKKQKMSEQDYMKAFADLDERYAKMLTALLAQLRKTS